MLMFVVSLSLGTSCVGLCYSSGPDQGLGPDFNAPTTKKKGGASRRVAFHAPSNAPRRSHSTKDNDWILVGHGLRVQHSRGGGSGGRCVPIFSPRSHAFRCMRLKRDVRFAHLLEGKKFLWERGVFQGLLSYRKATQMLEGQTPRSRNLLYYPYILTKSRGGTAEVELVRVGSENGQDIGTDWW